MTDAGGEWRTKALSGSPAASCRQSGTYTSITQGKSGDEEDGILFVDHTFGNYPATYMYVPKHKVYYYYIPPAGIES
jgi:hypothetical protein